MDRLACDRMFVTVLETGSFAVAAARLGVSSGQASKLVSRLESEMGAQLLHRTTRALSTTEVGQTYFDRIRPLLAEFEALDDAIRNRSGELVGRLRITAPASFGVSQLAPALLDLLTAHPKLELDVSFSDRVINLVDEGFDAAVRVGTINATSLIARKLTEARIVLVAASTYLRSAGTPASIEDLPSYTCIIDTNFRDPLRWRFRRGDVEQHIEVAGRLRLASAEACLEAAERGLGITRAPTFMAGERLRQRRLVTLLPDWEDKPLDIHVVYPPSRHLALKLRVFVDFLARHFKGRPAWDKGW